MLVQFFNQMATDSARTGREEAELPEQLTNPAPRARAKSGRKRMKRFMRDENDHRHRGWEALYS